MRKKWVWYVSRSFRNFVAVYLPFESDVFRLLDLPHALFGQLALFRAPSIKLCFLCASIRSVLCLYISMRFCCLLKVFDLRFPFFSSVS